MASILGKMGGGRGCDVPVLGKTFTRRQNENFPMRLGAAFTRQEKHMKKIFDTQNLNQKVLSRCFAGSSR